MIEEINLDEGLYKALIRDFHTEEAVVHFIERMLDGWLIDNVDVTESKELCLYYLSCLGAISYIRINRMSDNMMKCMKIRTIQHCLKDLVNHITEYVESIKSKLPIAKFSDVNDREKKLNTLSVEYVPEIVELILKVV